jgi:hypothetical protein
VLACVPGGAGAGSELVREQAVDNKTNATSPNEARTHPCMTRNLPAEKGLTSVKAPMPRFIRYTEGAAKLRPGGCLHQPLCPASVCPFTRNSRTGGSRHYAMALHHDKVDRSDLTMVGGARRGITGLRIDRSPACGRAPKSAEI